MEEFRLPSLEKYDHILFKVGLLLGSEFIAEDSFLDLLFSDENMKETLRLCPEVERPVESSRPLDTFGIAILFRNLVLVTFPILTTWLTSLTIVTMIQVKETTVRTTTNKNDSKSPCLFLLHSP